MEAPTIGVDYLQAQLRSLSQQPGVYQMFDANAQLLYIGKAKNLKKRVSQYAQLARLEPHKQRMVMQISRLEITITHSEAEALLLEAELVKSLQPKYNILLKDDKSFPYITFSSGKTATTQPFARVVKHRGHKKEDQFYYGPFASTSAVNKTITTLQTAFLLRNCSDTNFTGRTRPCLEYQIKRCTAPCVGHITPEAYAQNVAQAQAVLEGKSQHIQQALQQQMQAASHALEYEKAAQLRNRLAALQHILAGQSMQLAHTEQADVFVCYQAEKTVVYVLFVRHGRITGTHFCAAKGADEAQPSEVLEAAIGQFYQRHPIPALLLTSHVLPHQPVLEQALSRMDTRIESNNNVHIAQPKRGEKAKLVALAEENARQHVQSWLMETGKTATLHAQLAELFGIERVIGRIEIYDNSHIFGQHATGAMVVAGLEGFEKQEYRRFNVDAGSKHTGGDDYHMMQQVLTRRLQRLLAGEDQRPDLLLIDGGVGHLSVVYEVMQALQIEDIAYVCIAKGQDRNAGREWFHQPEKAPFQLPVDDPRLHYLQRLRDEAHRFAIFTHRAKRSKSLTQNPIDAIPGIGPTRRKALLQYFGSFRALSGASLAEIEHVPHISKKLAKNIYEYLH